jgi:hypothetical protein
MFPRLYTILTYSVFIEHMESDNTGPKFRKPWKKIEFALQLNSSPLCSFHSPLYMLAATCEQSAIHTETDKWNMTVVYEA